MSAYISNLNLVNVSKSVRSVWLMLIMIFSVTASATDNYGKLDTLSISVVEAKPWGWNEGHNLQGVLYDLAGLVAQELGVELDARSGSVARVILQVSTGESDFIYFIDHPGLNKVADNVIELGVKSELQLWQRADSDWSLDKPLQDLRIATSIQGAENMPLLANVKVDHVHTADLLVPMLAAGRVDAVLELSTVLEYSRVSSKKPRHQFNSLAVEQIPSYLWVSKKSKLSAQEIERVGLAVIKVSSPEVFQELIQFYIKDQ